MTEDDKRFGSALTEFELIVPVDYNHDTQIDTFRVKTEALKTTSYFYDELTSKNFAKATNKLIPAKKYKVKIFPILAEVSSSDCLSFLAKQKVILVGGQGLTLVQDLKSEEFPVDKTVVSFDEKNTLWEDSDEHPRVPSMSRSSDGEWNFGLLFWKGAWYGDMTLLCFSEM